ncbi:unnamed protein product [Protopolystoma xenopodis]|uniref:Uncharacterized protein n=1 Tax=Protopolystoma xenopodis TaxID=117903 RepID=A0A448WFK7_9PLAT|nr:unnamed protein product [Protopolystoma xenopodis]
MNRLCPTWERRKLSVAVCPWATITGAEENRGYILVTAQLVLLRCQRRRRRRSRRKKCAFVCMHCLLSASA